MRTPPHTLTDADWERYRELRKNNAALRVAAAKARSVLAEEQRTVKRLSDLLDEVLPPDRAQQDRVALAIDISASDLDALRRHRVDPLSLPPYSLFSLAEEFGIQAEQLRTLLAADHARFANVAANPRGAEEANLWAAFDEASRRARQENPALFTATDRSDD